MLDKIKRVNKDAAVGCAFMFMEKPCLTKEEVDSYLEIVKGLLPEGHILFGVSDALNFVAERYGVIEKKDDLYFITGDAKAFNYYFVFRTPSSHIQIFKEACDILKSIEEISDEVTTSENMTLKKTI